MASPPSLTFTFSHLASSAHVFAPHVEALVALAGMDADAQGRADMIEHDHRFRKGAGEIDQVRQLRFEQPSVEAEPQFVQQREAFAERAVAIEPRRHAARKRAQHFGVVVMGGAVADAAEAAMPRRDMRAQDVLGHAAQSQIDVADDAGAGAHGPVESARAHGGDAVDEFRLADAAQIVGPVGAVHGTAFHIDGADDVVPASKIAQKLVEQVTRHAADDVHEAMRGRRQVLQDVRRPVPQMMMRIDDRQIRFEDVFGHAFFLRLRPVPHPLFRHRPVYPGDPLFPTFKWVTGPRG